MKFKVWVNTHGDPEGSFATNAMEYDTLKEAEDAAQDLFQRWTAVNVWEVRKGDEVVLEGP